MGEGRLSEGTLWQTIVPSADERFRQGLHFRCGRGFSMLVPVTEKLRRYT
jgi:hypothetical protein